MDRNEAVLRELNLYPQWVRRDAPVAEEAAVPAAVGVDTEQATVAAMPVEAAAPAEQQAATQPPVSELRDVLTVEPHHEEYAPDLPMPDGEWHPEDVDHADAVTAPVREEDALASLGWPELKQKVRDCAACGLRTGCTQTVFGVGDEQADWLFVGEGPGTDEDLGGEPFVGEAGKLLDNMLLALQLKRGVNVYIANVVKCHPPENRPPHVDEIAVCLPYLHRQIALIQPKVIVALGKTAATALLGSRAALGPLRGAVHDLNGVSLIATYHPAYLLRSPQDKAKAWQDLRLAQQTQRAES